MTNERNRAAVDVQVKAVDKKKAGLLIILITVISAILVSFYLFFRAPIAMDVTSTVTYQTFNSSLIPMKTSLNIVGIGDSLTKGVGDLKQQGYAGMTVQALKSSKSTSNISFNDYGIKGDTTDDLLEVLKKENVQKSIKNADIIFMTIGGNDVVNVLKRNFLNLNVNDFEKRRLVYQRNFNEILQTIYRLNPKVTVYYLGLYNPFEDLFPDLDPKFQSILDQWNRSSKTILELFPHTYFVPTADLFKNKTTELLYTDHFHPNKKGYQLISERLVKVIENK